MNIKIKFRKPFRPPSLMLFLLLGIGMLSCNNPETREQQNEMMHEEDEMMHDDGHMMEGDTIHEDMMQEDTLMHNGM